MSTSLNVYYAMKLWHEREPGKDYEFTKNYHDEWKIVLMVRELRKHG